MNPAVVHVLQDKLGGITSIVEKLLSHGDQSDGGHAAVLVDSLLDVHPRTQDPLPARTTHRVSHRLPRENLHAVLRRLRQAIPRGPGVLVAHDWLELAMAHHVDPERHVMQVLHGDMEYYYLLAERHAAVIDTFVTYSRACQAELRERIPERAEDIHMLPYGIETDVPVRTEPAPDGRLRLCFCGRLDHGHKGVFDLPAIDAALRAQGVDVQWTLIGAGPDEDKLQALWPASDRVHWLGRRANEDVRTLLAEQDVFVLPTRREGFPVALLEAMAAGLVPVVSDIRSGVPEVVEPGQNGYRPAVGDVAGFADALTGLAQDRALLASMSQAARKTVVTRYQVAACVGAWDRLFATCAARPRRPWRRLPLPYGSRLDQPWIPNALVKVARARRPIRETR